MSSDQVIKQSCTLIKFIEAANYFSLRIFILFVLIWPFQLQEVHSRRLYLKSSNQDIRNIMYLFSHKAHFTQKRNRLVPNLLSSYFLILGFYHLVTVFTGLYQYSTLSIPLLEENSFVTGFRNHFAKFFKAHLAYDRLFSREFIL